TTFMHDTTPRPPPSLGNVFIALLCLIWGSTWIVIQRGLADLPPFTSAAARFVVAASVMSAAASAFRRRESGRSPELWLCAVVGTAVTFGLYFWLLRHLPAHKLSLISYVTPAIALLLGAIAGDEPFTAATAIGSALILAGVWLVVRRSAPKAAPEEGALPAET